VKRFRRGLGIASRPPPGCPDGGRAWVGGLGHSGAVAAAGDAVVARARATVTPAGGIIPSELDGGLAGVIGSLGGSIDGSLAGSGPA
jgi:hypothetical protein